MLSRTSANHVPFPAPDRAVLVFHEVVAEHVTNDHACVFNPPHVRLRYLNLQIRQAQFCIVAKSSPQRRTQQWWPAYLYRTPVDQQPKAAKELLAVSTNRAKPPSRDNERAGETMGAWGRDNVGEHLGAVPTPVFGRPPAAALV